MSRLGFSIKNACLRICYQKTISFIIILSIAIGMIFPLAAFAMTNDLLQNIKASEYMDEEHTVIAEFFSPFEIKEKIDGKLKYVTRDIQQFGYLARYESVVTWKGKDMACSATGATLSYFDLENYTMVEGKLFDKEQEESGANVCILKKDGTLWKKGAKTGDSIEINGIKFKIIGEIRDPKLYGGIILPYNSLNRFLENNKKQIQYKALFLTEKLADTDKISENIKKADMKLLSVITALEGQSIFLKSAKEVITKNIILGLFVLLFGAISFIFIIVGKVSEEQYSIGVKMSLGASKGMIYMELFFQNMILIIAAILIDIACFPIVKKLMPQLGFVINWTVILGMIIIGLFLAFVVTGVIFKKLIKNKEVYNLLKENG